MLPAVLVPDYTFQQHLILVCVNAAFELYSHLMLSTTVFLRSNRGNKLLGHSGWYLLHLHTSYMAGNGKYTDSIVYACILRVIIVTTLCTSKYTLLNYDRKAI